MNAEPSAAHPGATVTVEVFGLVFKGLGVYGEESRLVEVFKSQSISNNMSVEP